MRTIKVFLASSIEEFENERYKLTSMLESLNQYGAKTDFRIEVKTCERSSRALSMERKQNEYNELICDSDYFIMLIGKKVGGYTVEEFNVALEQFHKCRAPQIYTYFKQLPEGEHPDRSVLDFKEQLENQRGHFYSTFSDVDTIRADFWEELMRKGLLDKSGFPGNPAVQEMPYQEKEKLVNLMFGLFQKSNDFQDPVELQREVLTIHHHLNREKSEEHASDVAKTNHKLALLLEKMKRKMEAEEMYREALEMYRGLVVVGGVEKYGADKALVENNLAVLLNGMGQKKEAQELCQEAWETYLHLAEEYPEKYEADAARIGRNLEKIKMTGESD